MQTNWAEVTHFAGFDWAKDHHDVLVLDGTGKTAAEFRFEHTSEGWAFIQSNCGNVIRPSAPVHGSIHLSHHKEISRNPVSDPAHETRGLQPERTGRVRCTTLGGVVMGTLCK